MESVQVVPVYAAILGVAYGVLSMRVIRRRRREQVSLGSGSSAALEQCVRAHGNFIEYVPMVLLLLLIAELVGAPHAVLHAIASTLVVGRLLHALAFSGPRMNFRLRVAGMMLTFISLFASSANAFIFWLR